MVLALFDMDKTLLRVSSGVHYLRWLALRGGVSAREVIDTFVLGAQYRAGKLDFPRVMARIGTRLRGGRASAAREMSQRWFDTSLVREIAPLAVQRLREHEAQGDAVYLLSASTQFTVEPVARHLRVPYRCTELELDGDHITGGIRGEACFGAGKVHWAARIAEERGMSLSEAVFYSDSISDLPLMLAVGHPIAINPDRGLRRAALERGWPVEKFY